MYQPAHKALLTVEQGQKTDILTAVIYNEDLHLFVSHVLLRQPKHRPWRVDMIGSQDIERDRSSFSTARWMTPRTAASKGR